MANPRGERTPYGPGEEWPVRADQSLEEGVSEEEMDARVPKTPRANLNQRSQPALSRWCRAGGSRAAR